ncbi:MAG: peptide MFS transporter [Pseudomonadota bacterium]
MAFILFLTAVGTVGFVVALYLMRGQPAGLYVCFFTEMWERFSYYGMRAILIFYLTKHFLFDRETAYGIYGAYVTLIYITPVIGGVIADRILGQRKSIIFGALLLVVGHALMAFEGEPATVSSDVKPITINLFYLALAFIVVGVGFLKANISTIVGELYPKTDQRRDSAFTYFHVGINIGAFFGALYVGFVGETYGWEYGFGLAGIGMLFGLAVFVFGKPYLNGAGEAPCLNTLNRNIALGLSLEKLTYALGLLGVIVCFLLVRAQDSVGFLLAITGFSTVCYVLYKSVFTLEPEARDRIYAALIFIVMNVFFWSLFEQVGSTLNIYTDENVDRHIFGQEIPASVFQSLGAMYIIILGPLFAAFWMYMYQRNIQFGTFQKGGLGIVLLGAGFLVLVFGANSTNELTPVLFIFLLYLLHTIGEILISPTGLSAMTRLSVSSMVGLIMGTYFLSFAGGNFVASLLAQSTVTAPSRSLGFFEIYGWIAVGVGVGVIIIAPFLQRLMHLDTLNEQSLVGSDGPPPLEVGTEQ